MNLTIYDIIRYYCPFRKDASIQTLFQSLGYVTYLFLTLSPLTIYPITLQNSPFDLHVLAMPPAFVLSQDQTLQFISLNPPLWAGSFDQNQLKFAHATKVVDKDPKALCTLF